MHICCQYKAVDVVGKSVTAQTGYPAAVHGMWRSLWQLVREESPLICIIIYYLQPHMHHSLVGVSHRSPPNRGWQMHSLDA